MIVYCICKYETYNEHSNKHSIIKRMERRVRETCKSSSVEEEKTLTYLDLIRRAIKEKYGLEETEK